MSEERMLSLGRLNKKTAKDGTTYYVGNILVKKLRDAEIYKDNFNNEKIGIVVFTNQYKQKETDADFKIFESRKPEPQTGDNADGKTTNAAGKTTDLPF